MTCRNFLSDYLFFVVPNHAVISCIPMYWPFCGSLDKLFKNFSLQANRIDAVSVAPCLDKRSIFSVEF